MDDRPDWARRMLEERIARDMSQADAVKAMRPHIPYDPKNPDGPTEDSLLDQWKRWENGKVFPEQHKEAIAATFSTTTGAFFPERPRRDGPSEILAVSSMETNEIVARLRASDLNQATLDALQITVDRLCCEYAYMPADQLLTEGRAWLARVVGHLHRRVSLSQLRDLYAMAGKLSLLVGCVEYDSGLEHHAEATRRAALSLAEEAGHLGFTGWAYEMKSWFALTRGDYHGAIRAAGEGISRAPDESVAAQLYAQQAKAWARLGNRQQTEVALDKGRLVLEALPYPDSVEDHFVVDPAKYDFYKMDCYRQVGEDRLAEQIAKQVIRASTDFNGLERAPMRISEARLTLGVVAARSGDLDTALSYGERALSTARQSLPHLSMLANDFGHVLETRYAGTTAATDFMAHVHTLKGEAH